MSGSFTSKRVFRDEGQSALPHQLFVAYSTEPTGQEPQRQALFAVIYRSGGGGGGGALAAGSALIEYALGPHPEDVGEVIREHSGPATSDSLLAPAGVDANNALGGYRPGRRNFFMIAGGRLSVEGPGGVVVISDLHAFFAAHTDVDSVSCGNARYTGIHHDPATRRLLIRDACNSLVWVLGYDAPLGPLSIRGVIRPPVVADSLFGNEFGYDPVRHVLWVGTYGVPVDLASF